MPSWVRTFDRTALQRLWRDSGLSAGEVARRVGLGADNPGTASQATQHARRWLEGERTPDVRYLPLLASAFGVAAHELTTRKPDQARLYDLRVWQGLSQRELAERAGLRAVRYGRIENGTVIRFHDGDAVAGALTRAFGLPEQTVRMAMFRTRDDAIAARLSEADPPTSP